MPAPAPAVVRTHRLSCEPLSVAHADGMFSVLADPRVYVYLDEAPPADVEALRHRYLRQVRGRNEAGDQRWLNWILLLNLTRAPIGFFQATIEAETAWIAYVIAPVHWGQGYAFEAASAILADMARCPELRVLKARVDRDNQASLRLLGRLGFRFEADRGAKDVVYRRELC